MINAYKASNTIIKELKSLGGRNPNNWLGTSGSGGYYYITVAGRIDIIYKTDSEASFFNFIDHAPVTDLPKQIINYLDI